MDFLHNYTRTPLSEIKLNIQKTIDDLQKHNAIIYRDTDSVEYEFKDTFSLAMANSQINEFIKIQEELLELIDKLYNKNDETKKNIVDILKINKITKEEFKKGYAVLKKESKPFTHVVFLYDLDINKITIHPAEFDDKTDTVHLIRYKSGVGSNHHSAYKLNDYFVETAIKNTDNINKMWAIYNNKK